jgi:tripartite-type tricarboxylate transporter receptor subunit TctC
VLKLCTVVATLFWVTPSFAQDRMGRPITMVVPFAAGGSSDAVGRVLSEGMQKHLGGQSIVIENVGGAGGSIGVARAARSAPDGLTLVLGSWPTHVVGPGLSPVAYDPINDFEPISLATATSFMIIARNDHPAKNLLELVDWLKTRRTTQATTGSGGGSHIGGLLLRQATGAHVEFVPYRGGAPAMLDLLAGNIDFMIDGPSNALGYVKSGRVKAYAMMGPRRLESLPEVPTVDEVGMPGLYVLSWHGLWAPKGTPADVIERLNSAATAALTDPAVMKRLSDIGQDPFPREQLTVGAARKYLAEETAKWAPILRQAKADGK